MSSESGSGVKCWRRRGALAVAVVVAVIAHMPLPTELLLQPNASLSCQKSQMKALETNGCPVKMSLRQSEKNCITIRVWIKDEDLNQAPTIGIVSARKEILLPVIKYNRTKKKWRMKKGTNEIRVWCHDISAQHGPRVNNTETLWELMYDCVEVEPRHPVIVSYITQSQRCSTTSLHPNAVPRFNLSLDLASKSINVTVESDQKVHARLCYKRSAHHCVQGSHSNIITIDPTHLHSALLKIPYMLPCVCVQVYYIHEDPPRKTVCPLQAPPLLEVEDVWLSSELTVYESSLTLSTECPARYFPISTSLCWRIQENLCIPVANATLLAQQQGPNLVYNTSLVDKHPRMCVKFSLRNSHNISCPFLPDMSLWHVSLEATPHALIVHVNSSVPGVFSAQLCVQNERGCESSGPVSSIQAKEATESQIRVPLDFVAMQACVQVWRTSPALIGQRILCPHYRRERLAVRALAALILLLLLVFFGIFMHALVKKGAADWLYIQRPVLLVCSSELSSHISASRALASLLRGDLGTTVHMALCAPSSQGQAGTGTSIADLGPLPWLYGQWEAVQEACGKVLIVWSPDANRTFGEWRRRTHGGEDEVHDAGGQGKLLEDHEDLALQKSPSAIIQPVLEAALDRLEVALQKRKGGSAAFVYFGGLGHRGNIPKVFRDVPRFCIPRDLGGLIRELKGLKRTKGTLGWHCWPRLVSKWLTTWLVRKLARRLRTQLPPEQR
ncbi:interleukin-17 receptor E [Stigmatopora nigra]